MGHGLCADVFLYGHRVVRTPLDRGVVGHKEAFSAVNHADARHDSSRVRPPVVKLESGQRGQLKKRCSRVDDLLNSFASEVFASGAVPVNVLPSTAF